MLISVMSGGNGGLALAAAYSLDGHRVRLFSRDRQKRDEIIARNGIHLTGVRGEHDVQLEAVVDDASTAVAGADLVILPVPGMVQERYLQLLLPHLDARQALWLCPGNGASLLASRIREELGLPPLLLIETATLPYAARRVGPASVHSRARIRSFLATFPARRYDEARALVGQLGEVVPAANVIETILLNVNAMIHPLPALLNWGWIESREGAFSLYGEGMSPGVLRCVEQLDQERYRLCEALGLKAMPLDEIYAQQGIPPLYRLAMNIGRAERFEDRFVTEDVPVGLVTIASLASQFDVPTPVTNATVALAEAIYGESFSLHGRTTERLGISEMTKRQLLAYLESGSPAPEASATRGEGGHR